MRHAPRGWLLTLVASLAAAPAFPLLLPVADLDQLVESADAIVVGRVVARRAAWNDEQTRIYTHYTVEVEHTVKGFAVPRIELTELGGQVGGLAMEVDGAPVYEPGEEAVIFLHADRGRVMTLRWFQGKLPIVRDRRGVGRVTLPGSAATVSLSEFERRVRLAVERQTGGPR